MVKLIIIVACVVALTGAVSGYYYSLEHDKRTTERKLFRCHKHVFDDGSYRLLKCWRVTYTF